MLRLAREAEETHLQSSTVVLVDVKREVVDMIVWCGKTRVTGKRRGGEERRVERGKLKSRMRTGSLVLVLVLVSSSS